MEQTEKGDGDRGSIEKEKTAKRKGNTGMQQFHSGVGGRGGQLRKRRHQHGDGRKINRETKRKNSKNSD